MLWLFATLALCKVTRCKISLLFLYGEKGLKGLHSSDTSVIAATDGWVPQPEIPCLEPSVSMLPLTTTAVSKLAVQHPELMFQVCPATIPPLPHITVNVIFLINV